MTNAAGWGAKDAKLIPFCCCHPALDLAGKVFPFQPLAFFFNSMHPYQDSSQDLDTKEDGTRLFESGTFTPHVGGASPGVRSHELGAPDMLTTTFTLV